MKPTFIICSGTGWSATTPLWYTLTLDNQYLHTGYKKEGGYLNNVDSTPAQRFLIEKNNKAKRGQSKSDHMREWAKNRVEINRELMKKLEKFYFMVMKERKSTLDLMMEGEFLILKNHLKE